MNIELPDDTYEMLCELADMRGVTDADKIAVVKVIDSLVQDEMSRLDQPEPGTISPIQREVNRSIATMVAARVSAITEYNAGSAVTINEQAISVKDVETPLSFEELKVAAPKDRILILCTTEFHQKVVVDLYSNLPKDLWGTDKAKQLFDRHLYLIANQSRDCPTCEE